MSLKHGLWIGMACVFVVLAVSLGALPARAQAPVAIAAATPQEFYTDFVKFDPDQYPDAMCNDGSPAGYDVQRPVEGSSDWVIYLNGGGYCSDDLACRARWRSLSQYMSSNSWIPFDFSSQGIVSSNGIFSQLNRVNLRYCSSDLWTGSHVGIFDAQNPPPSRTAIPVSNWHFRGTAITEAAFDDLFRFGLGDAQTVLIVGASAGGFGVMSNMDRYAADLQARIPGVAVRGIADAGWLYPAIPFSGPVSLAHDILTEAMNNWEGQDGINQACRAALGPDEAWRCYLGGAAGPYIQSQLLVMEHQVDTFMLQKFGGVRFRATKVDYAGQQYKGYNPASLSSGELQYMADYASCLRASLPALGDNISYYLPFDPGQIMVHVMTAGNFFTLPFNFPEGVVRPVQAIAEWLAAIDAGDPSLYANYVSAVPTDLPFPAIADCARVQLP